MKQTKDLVSKGYVTGRGKLHGGAFASGTAYPTGSGKFGRYTFDGEGGWKEYDVNNNLVDASSSLAAAADALSDASDEFSEVFDWIEVRIEELDETLGLLESQIENAVSYNEKNTIIDDLINTNKIKLDNLEAGYEKYAAYAEELLTRVPEEYHDAVKNGAIEIEAFVGEADEATLEAIQNYREWAQKSADFKQQANEIITTIRDLAIQKFDNAYESGNVRATVEDSQTEKIQNQIDLLEEMGEVASAVYYGINGGDAASSTGMFENSYKKIEYLTEARKAMQEELNTAVEAGQIQKGSNEWYELIDQMYQIDSEIAEANMELEEFQNAINDIKWENFDQLISRLDYLKDETQSLIDLMDSDDMIVDPAKKTYEGGTIEYWTADDVKWTDEGLATLGLYAQQMEIAEYTSRQYAEAIDDLTKDYEDGLYSENEYIEKLNELKEGQYESIEAYYDAQDAIVDLNKTRIDSIKKGIEKELDAYEELIEKKKEALDVEKDLYDFQKGVADQQKNIADIERKLAALANDNSLSAVAKRKQLEAELAEAQYELEDTYYNRSVDDKQNALDKELEDFQTEKDLEIQKWEEYLDNVEAIIIDSLNVVQANALGIGQTLTDKANEYNLTISDAILTPWEDGSLAINDYQKTFDTSISSTMDQLELLKQSWQEVIDKMTEAAEIDMRNITKENMGYTAAEETIPEPEPPAPEPPQEQAQNARTDEEYNAVAWEVINGNYGWGNGTERRQKLEAAGYDPDRVQKLVNQFWNQTHPKYASGTTGVKNDQFALIDELGEELVLHASGGRLAYLTKGSAVIPHNISENLMKLGSMDPQEMLDRNRPQISPSKSVVNTNMEINMNIAEVVHIDSVSNDTIPDLTKAVRKEMDTYMIKLNNAIKSKVR